MTMFEMLVSIKKLERILKEMGKDLKNQCERIFFLKKNRFRIGFTIVMYRGTAKSLVLQSDQICHA